MARSTVAAIDCGTNSIRLLIAEIEGDAKTDLLREMRVVRLGQGVDETGTLAPEAVERTLEACREYGGVIDAMGVDVVSFAATSAMRDADNAADFSDRVEEILGVRPRVLTGEEEARASFEGATGDVAEALTAVIDLGGGSTEVVQGLGAPTFSHSFDLGSVRMTERFLLTDPPSVAEVTACMTHLDAVLAPVLSRLEPSDEIVGVAGTITTIAAHSLALPSYDSEVIHQARIHVDDVRAACGSLMQMPVADRRALPYMHPGRADVIAGGALILDRVLEHLPRTIEELVVSEQDILDGIAWAAAREVA
ncbi:Ppx/GppA family phosphatase [Aeromicrobium tamlense]|uniref:Exopolyphosphatase/guanosine-5'-triphosphate, 3'-diphosphate pyrophosphatase n=1 Tax=Aeromicrobium tamlense TaxID=375541 RepID=A0A8I0FUZ2_9ACTN|nr:Ppx/GppA phosphatase family protein [Aeromicrobium tamlense]MBD1269073.1 Ppx/GppA family phosphatase [Aeromicrobium tamlense]NYI37018.1 exopolyphosphatase/guanosine-5'-triphosphate,3'-diphosphate pyrophosphatase [Aeromicrobium tamlense]